MKPQNTKPISSICAKMLTAVLMFVAAAAVTLGLSASTVFAGDGEDQVTLTVGQTITFKTSDYSKVVSENPKVAKVTKKNGKYIVTAMKAPTFQEDEKDCYFGEESTTLKLYKKGKKKAEIDVKIYNKSKRILVGKSVSYKASKYSKVTSDDPKIAKVKKKNGKYVVTAKKEGATRLRFYNKKGKLSKVISVAALKKSTLKSNKLTITIKKGEKLEDYQMLDKLKKLSIVKRYWFNENEKSQLRIGLPWSSDVSALSLHDFYYRAKKKGKVTLMVPLMTADDALVKIYKVTVKIK